MKSFFNWLKDFIYDSIDYIIMIVIIITVVFVIGWRLDVLFANDATDIPHKNIIISNGEDVPKNPNVIKPEVLDPEVDVDLTPGEPEDSGETPSESPVTETPVVVDAPSEVVTASVSITIPPGSLPSKIGDILESNGLINSRKDFVNKAQELKLDTKLKSGTYKIPTNSTLEEVLKIITK